jgi:hypothetical protein
MDSGVQDRRYGGVGLRCGDLHQAQVFPDPAPDRLLLKQAGGVLPMSVQPIRAFMQVTDERASGDSQQIPRDLQQKIHACCCFPAVQRILVREGDLVHCAPVLRILDAQAFEHPQHGDILMLHPRADGQTDLLNKLREGLVLIESRHHRQ